MLVIYLSYRYNFINNQLFTKKNITNLTFVFEDTHYK
jgi:hypothetical protein